MSIFLSFVFALLWIWLMAFAAGRWPEFKFLAGYYAGGVLGAVIMYNLMRYL